MSKRLSVGWTGHGHTGVDVGVWAYGPIADLVKGDIDNTDIAKSGAKVIGVDLNAATQELQAKYLYPMFKVSREGAVLFPVRALATELGATVAWDDAARSAVLTQGSNKFEYNVDSKKLMLNGADSSINAQVDNGSLYMSLDAFNQLTGKNMTWDKLSERIVK